MELSPHPKSLFSYLEKEAQETIKEKDSKSVNPTHILFLGVEQCTTVTYSMETLKI